MPRNACGFDEGWIFQSSFSGRKRTTNSAYSCLNTAAIHAWKHAWKYAVWSRSKMSGSAPHHEKFLWLFTMFHNSKSIHIPEELCGELRKYKGVLILNLYVGSASDPCVQKGKASLVCCHSSSNQPPDSALPVTCRVALKLPHSFSTFESFHEYEHFAKMNLHS